MADQNNQYQQASAWPLAIVVVILVMAAGWFIWRKRHDEIAYAMLTLSYFEALPGAFVSGSNAFLQEIVGAAARAGEIEFAEAYSIMFKAGLLYAALPLALGVGIGLTALRHPYHLAIRRHDADSLLAAGAQNFSAMAPMVGRDLTDDTSTEWAPSRKPEEWANERLLVKGGRLDRVAALEAFEHDLGSRLGSVNELPDCAKALLGVFCEFAAGDKKQARTVLDALNRSAANAKCRPNYALADTLYQKHKDSALVKEELVYHGYVSTLMMRLLEIARERIGVLAPSEFIWMKPTHRHLWYALNTLGRKVAFVESAAAFAQLQAEKLARSRGMALDPAKPPCLEEAVGGLERDLVKTGTIEKPLDTTWQ